MPEEMSKEEVDRKVAEMNVFALLENITEMRTVYEARLIALENEVATLRKLVQNQTQVIGQSIQALHGSGSTVADPTPEDLR